MSRNCKVRDPFMASSLPAVRNVDHVRIASPVQRRMFSEFAAKVWRQSFEFFDRNGL
jgi:hypothetical protein